MTYKSAGAVATAAPSTALAYTVHTGVVATDTVLFVCAWGNSTAGTVSLAVPGGASYGTLIPSRNDNNMGWIVFTITGVVAGDTITATFSVAASGKIGQTLAFTAPVGLVGAVGNRGGVSQALVTAPALSGAPSGTPILALSLERSTATGTVVSSVVPSSGETVTNLSFVEKTGDPDVSINLARFTSTSSPTGSVAITYSGASTNGAAVLITEVVVAPSAPSISPSFNGGTDGKDFSASVTTPGAAAAFKTAGPLVASAGTASLTIPNGTTVSDYVYVMIGWSSATSRVVDWGGRTVAEVLPVRADGNMSWGVYAFTNVLAGDVVTVSAEPGTFTARAHVFDRALSTAGAVGRRTTSTEITAIPGVPIETSTPVYLFAAERTLADGTTVVSATNSLGGTVAQLAYAENINDPDISFYVARVNTPGLASGDTTLTYASASGNGAGVAVPAVRGSTAISPVFGGTISGILGSFTAKITPAVGVVRAMVGRPDPTKIRVKALVNVTLSVSDTIRLAASTASNMASPVYGSGALPDSDGYVYLECAVPSPDTLYYWQLEIAGALTGPIGQCRTFPAEGVPFARGAIIHGACTAAYGSSGNASNPATFNFMRAKLDGAGIPARLHVALGDEMYPNSGTSPIGTIMPGNPSMIRNWWEGQHQQANRSAFHRVIPATHTYSDNDYIGSNSDSTMAPSVAAISNAVRRQVWCDGPLPAADNKGLYWSQLFGRVLLIQTDSRTYSSNTLLAQNTPGKSMLGATQKAWLLAQFARTDYVGIIWFHDNQWVGNPGVSTGRPALDNWQAFSVERDEIAAYIRTNNIPVLLYVHGDNHDMAYDDGTNNLYGGFPFFCCAPMANSAQPFPAEAQQKYPTSAQGNLGSSNFFGWLELTDNGETVTIDVAGVDVTSGTPVTRVSAQIVHQVRENRETLLHEFYGAISRDDITPAIG